MHTFSDSGTGVPAFLAKLWRLVEDGETNDLISWNADGKSFIIQNQAQFAKELLPLNYKHNNMASFIRQLNMYGFHKITSIDNGGLRFDRDEMEFTHPCFQKDHPYLLEHIKRKIATSKQQDDKAGGFKIEAVNRVLSEVKNMRGRQDSLDSRFSAMKQENEVLWREIAVLRQKHLKQQQIVNKLIQFLVTIVQPSRGGLGSMGNGNNKRRFQLMINDSPQQAKLKKTENSEGASIQELGEVLEEAAFETEQELLPEETLATVEKPAPTVTAVASTSNGSGSKRQTVGPKKPAARNTELPEVTSPASTMPRSPYNAASRNEMIEEVLSPAQLPYGNRTTKPASSRSAIKREKLEDQIGQANLIQLIDNQAADEVFDDDEDSYYLVDHADELDPDTLQMYEDTDMLNTPMVIEAEERQQQLQQQQQQLLQQQQQLQQQQKQIQQQTGKGRESLLKPTKKNGSLSADAEKSSRNLPIASKASGSEIRGGKRLPVPVKIGAANATSAAASTANQPGNVAANFPNNGSNNVTVTAALSPDTILNVGDFTISSVGDDIFDENNTGAEKESPMLGSFSFDSGFYNPNVDINEIKGRSSTTTTPQQGVQPKATNSKAVEQQGTGNGESGSGSGNQQQQLTKFVKNDTDVARYNTVAEYGTHIDSMQNELESLKDLLKGEGYQLDANTLLGQTPSGNTTAVGRLYFPSSVFDPDSLSKLFNGADDMLGYDLPPLNLPDLSEEQRNASVEEAATNSASGVQPTATSSTTSPPSTKTQLMAYKTAAPSIMGDYVDLNELLNLDASD